jgi:midasin
MRTLCRTLSAARNLIIQQRFAPQRAILEGFQLAFEGSLDIPSRNIIKKQFTTFLPNVTSQIERDHPGRRPDGRNGNNSYELIKPFWVKSGNEEQSDWADPSTSSNGKPKFVLTPSATSNLRRLSQAVASGPWSILLEGPTSAGKTTLVEYLAARCGHRCVRINNHEHTDIQEYTGSYAADSKGKISFQEGILVQALRKGHWVILDELNLAPSEVLEALNRLLDDNRELYLPEINEAIKPHQNFRLFATQNPAGAYGGRKPLSRAFRNRFVEIHMSDIPEDEMILILERRCGCPPSHAKLLVRVMKSLRQRRSRTGIFRGKDGLITPRDLLRWAGRGSLSKTDLALEGYMLLAERLRIDEEKDVVRSVIEREFKVTIDVAEAYYGDKSEGRALLEHVLGLKSTLSASGLNVNSIAPTQSMMRLLTLVMRCVKQREPVLLVGDTGCGKVTANSDS